eukprot:UN05295
MKNEIYWGGLTVMIMKASNQIKRNVFLSVTLISESPESEFLRLEIKDLRRKKNLCTFEAIRTQ